MTDYLDKTAGNYYTQRWYIARREQGSIAPVSYTHLDVYKRQALALNIQYGNGVPIVVRAR